MRRSTALALLLAVTACAAPSGMTRVEDRLLLSLPIERLSPVRVAVHERSTADDVLASARHHERATAKSTRLARAELDIAIAGTREIRIALEAARRMGNAERTRGAEFRYSDALQTTAIARLAVALAKREHEVAELRETLAWEETRLADARIESAKGFAVDGTRRAADAGVPLEDLERQVMHHEDEVRGAQRRLSAARVDMQHAQDAYDEAVASARLADGR